MGSGDHSLALHLLPYRPLSWGAAVLMAGASAAFAAGTFAAATAGCAVKARRARLGILPDASPRAVELAATFALALLVAWLAFYLLDRER